MAGTGPVLKGQIYDQTRVTFGAGQVLQFPTFTLAAAQTTAAVGAAIALPCNVKALALAVNATGATGTMNVTLGSGYGAGTVLGTPDNFNIRTPTNAFVGLGQICAPLQPINTSLIPSTNQVVYFGLVTGGSAAPGAPTPPFSTAYFDMIFPPTRPLCLYLTLPTFTADVVVNASAFVMPVILDPNQPYPYAGMWVPNNTNMGAPSTA